MARPLVSVVMPLYNHARFVEAALMSVITQSYRPLELIVIDDGSSDGGAAVARRVLQAEMPEAVLIERENRGAHATLNQGLGLAQGEVLTILNSDDVYLPGRLQRSLGCMALNGAEFLFTGLDFIDEAGGPAEDAYVAGLRQTEAGADFYPCLGFPLLLSQLAVSTGNFIFTRRLWETVGGFRDYRYVHDWDFILRALPHTEPYWLREALYGYRIHGTNTFRGLEAVAGYETSEVMRNCMWSMVSRVPANGRAPSPYNWPGYFEWFAEVHKYGAFLPPDWPGVER